jgi:outer membrane usher protein
LTAIGPIPPPRHEAPPPPPPPPPFVESYFGVVINGIDTQDIALFVEDRQKNLWVSAKNLKKWNLELPKAQPLMYQNEPYYAINTQFKGITFQVDEATQVINVKIPADFFVSNVINANGSVTYDYTLPSPGGYLNYNLNGSTAPSGQNQYSALFTLGVFNSYGVGTSGFLTTTEQGVSNFLRLTTTWEYDNPQLMQSYYFGDSTSTITSWSGGNNFGGLQWTTNFATQPYFLTFPQPAMRGQAIVPTSLDLFINSALTFHKDLPPGKFALENIPLIDGAGNIKLVTRDVLGNEHVVSVPYYSSTTLLKEGLSDFGYEIGFLRENLGINSNDYAQLLIAATNNYGYSDDLTLQGHVEALPYEQALGIGAIKLVGNNLGVVNGTLAGSNSIYGKGMLLQLGYQYIAQQYTFTASNTLASNHFTQQGIPQGQFSPKLVTQVFLGFNNMLAGTLGVTYTHQVAHEAPLINLLTANYSSTIFKEIALGATWATNMGGPRNNTFMVNLIYSFGLDPSGSSTTLSFNRFDQNDARTYNLQLIRNLPPGPGYGYTLSATRGGGAAPSSSNSNLLNYSYQNDIGTYLAQVNTTQGQPNTYSANVQGAITRLDQHFFLARTINGAFGVAKVGDFANIPVYANNQLMSNTDKNGYALIPNLLAYDRTRININANKLPFDSKIGETVQYVAPYNNSGVVVKFDVKTSINATVTLKQSTGDFVPEGSSIQVVGQEQPYIVGMQGQAFLSDLGKQNQIVVTWPGHECKIDITTPAPVANNPIPDLGTIICKVPEAATPKVIPGISKRPETKTTTAPAATSVKVPLKAASA